MIGGSVPAGALGQLQGHPKLTEFSLAHCAVAKADLHAIGQIESLEVIDTASVPIGDAIIESWMDLPRLRYAHIVDSGVSTQVADRFRQKFPDGFIHFD